MMARRPARLRQALQLLGRTLAEWGWPQTGWALFVGAGTLFANGMPFGNEGGSGIAADAYIPLTYNVLQFGFPLVLLMGWAHRLVDAGLAPPGRLYAAVVLVEVPLGVWLIGPLLAPWLGSEPWWSEWNNVVLACTTLFWHSLGVAVAAQRHLQRRAEARREQAAQLHAERARELAATELLALQARVDPPLLFERLQAIDAELAQDPAQAARRLGALIDLLRALQPHAQARESTLGRELDAALAYARLISPGALGSERLALRPAGEAERTWPLAPLVLLPLLRPLLADPRLLWQLSLTGSARQLELAGLGPTPEALQAAAAAVDLEPLRQRLHTVLGPGAALRLDASGPLPRFLLDWPP